MAEPQTGSKAIREDFYNQSVAVINAYFDKELAKKSFFTSAKAIENDRSLELAKLEKKFFGRMLR